jgi:hypothetical protein
MGGPHLARFSRDVGYHEPQLSALQRRIDTRELQGEVRRIPYLARNERDTRISCTRHQATAACAAFIAESRMKLINANKLHRKSGDMGHPRCFGNYGHLSSVCLDLCSVVEEPAD